MVVLLIYFLIINLGINELHVVVVEVHYLNANLDGLSVSALGVRNALGVVQAVVQHTVLVFRLLLQREDHAPDVHLTTGLKIQRCRQRTRLSVRDGETILHS